MNEHKQRRSLWPRILYGCFILMSSLRTTQRLVDHSSSICRRARMAPAPGRGTSP